MHEIERHVRPQLIKMCKKVDAGAQFFQTHAVYDDRAVNGFIAKAAAFGRPIPLGVVVLKSPQMGAYMNRNVSGISVPQTWIDEIGSVAEASFVGSARRHALPSVRF